MWLWLVCYVLCIRRVLAELQFPLALNPRPECAPKIEPKVFIINMFAREGTAWYGIPEFNLLERNITVLGFSPLFPDAHCTADGSVCQLVTGEGEINAAVTLSALLHSPLFNLRRTYFLVAGIGGVSPKMGTLGSVTFPRFAVQVDLQFEVDAREIPPDFNTGYIPQGAFAPDQYPTRIYGTELFELNERLRDLAVQMARKATLFDDDSARRYRANYASNPLFKEGASPPSVVACDTATSDVFWSGALIAEAVENVTKLFTNNTGQYCTAQQEDNATLAALLRGAIAGAVDFSRIIILRTASNFDRPFNGQQAAENLFSEMNGFTASIMNLQIAGIKVVQGILGDWTRTFAKGVTPTNYVGDILGSLGGKPRYGQVAV